MLWYLSGLTCTHANVMDKGEYRAACAEHGIMFVAPDTSPRGEDVPTTRPTISARAPASTSTPRRHRGRRISACVSYIEKELPALIAAEFPVDMERQGITGHSMGGHGALTISLRNPGRFRSTSAFAPIVSPINCPWGEKALGGYLGEDIADVAPVRRLRADQAGRAAARAAGRPGHRRQFPRNATEDAFAGRGVPQGRICPPRSECRKGTTTRYFFISTFMAEHVAWHAERLTK